MFPGLRYVLVGVYTVWLGVVIEGGKAGLANGVEPA
jgi:hypothetical protein